jgi:type I restriction enzyme S subunit
MSDKHHKALGEVFTLQRGFDITKKEQSEGIYPVVSSSGINSYHNEFKVEAPGVVIGRKGTIGTAFYLEENYWPHDTSLWIKDFKGNDPKFLYYFLKTIPLQKLDSGSANPTLNRNFVHILEAYIPVVDEQKKIATVLSYIDEKIELNNKINADLEAMAQLIYDYWFLQFDFPDANGKPYKSSGGKMIFSDELNRKIPEGWEIKELDIIAKCIMGQSPKGDTYNNDGIGTALLNGPADYKNGALFGRTYTTAPTRLCEKNDMVLCIRATIGNLVYSEDQFCLGRGVAAVKPNDKTNSELIYFFILQEIQRFKMQATGSIIKGITKDDLAKSKCLVPSEKLALNFHKLINPMFDRLRKNKEETLKLIGLRDWLLPMLMNGQVTVKDE